MTLLKDTRYALRLFARQPAFAAAAVLSLGIGIGANTALFSVTNALLLRPLPYAHADRLAILWNRSPGLNITQDWFSTAQYFDIRNGNSSFEDVAVALGNTMNLTDEDDRPERVGVIRVSSNLLPLLGARASYGALFEAADDEAGRAPKAVLGHDTWLRRYAGDPDVVGRTIRLNGQAVEIAGVLAPGFRLPFEVLPTLGMADEGDIFLPLPMQPGAADFRGREDYNILARLKPGVTVAAAQADMDRITAGLRRTYPALYPPNGGLTFGVVPLLDQVVGNVRRPLLILLGAVGFVLLIACANVANLLLSRRARPAARDHGAVGAGRDARPRHAAAPHRVAGARGGGRVARAGAGVRGDRVGARAPAARRAAPRRHRDHARRARLHDRALLRVRPALRHGAGARHGQARPAVGAPRRGPGHGRHGLDLGTRRPPAPRAGGRRAGAVRGAADRRGPADPELQPAPRRAARLRSGGRVHVRAVARGAALPERRGRREHVRRAVAAARGAAGCRARRRRHAAAALRLHGVGADHDRGLDAARRRGLHQRGPARGRRALLRGDGHSARERAVLHGCGPRGRAARRRHRPVPRGPVLAGRGRGGEAAAPGAHLVGRGQLDDGGRRGRTREAVRAGHGRARRRLPGAAAVQRALAVRDGARGGPARGDRGRGAKGARVARSGPANVPAADHGLARWPRRSLGRASR